MKSKYLYSIFIDNSNYLFNRDAIKDNFKVLDEIIVAELVSRNFTRNQVALALCEIAEYYGCDIDRTLLWLYVSTFMIFKKSEFYFEEIEVEIHTFDDISGTELELIKKHFEDNTSNKTIKRWYYKNNNN